MTATKVRRKLTTIFYADVQNYSSMMGADEADTLGRLRRYRSIMSELFTRHDGRKVNTWGDAVIAEFPSVVEAVRCAVELQEALATENRELPPARQMWFRVGINLGDVMEDGDDLYGDGVNVAARLQSLAEAGGIMVSETVYNLTHKQLVFGYDFAGDLQVKGQDAPVQGYRVRMPWRNAPDSPTLERETAERESTVEDRGEPQGYSSANRSDRDESEIIIGGNMGRRLGQFRDWFNLQPRKVKNSVTMIGVFAALNLLTTGLSTLWFVWPSIPFAFIILRHLMRSRRSGTIPDPSRPEKGL